jgi:hypothetical protein
MESDDAPPAAHEAPGLPASDLADGEERPSGPRLIDFEVVIGGGEDDEPTIRQEFRSVDDLIAFQGQLVARGVAALVREAMDRRAGEGRDATAHRAARKGRGATEPLSDDAYIDQRSGLLAKEVFLRLHREKRIPTTKVGKRILARWGDVKEALRPQPQAAKPRQASVEEPPVDDGLDGLRRMVGLQPKGGR